MLFIDTWGWVALHNKREARHGEVKAFYREYRLNAEKIYTTDYVLDETFTLIFRRLPLGQAKISMESINNAIERKRQKNPIFSPPARRVIIGQPFNP